MENKVDIVLFERESFSHASLIISLAYENKRDFCLKEFSGNIFFHNFIDGKYDDEIEEEQITERTYVWVKDEERWNTEFDSKTFHELWFVLIRLGEDLMVIEDDPDVYAILDFDDSD